MVQPTCDVLLNAVRPLVGRERVGIMLSGGVGSAALLAAMKEAGVNVLVYHMEATDPTASELRFARHTCDALDVPLTRLCMDNDRERNCPSSIIIARVATTTGKFWTCTQ